eukprot:1154588-Pelagomonas_calceolata.AAC.1
MGQAFTTLHHLALFLVAGLVSFLCLPCFSQSELCGGEVIRQSQERIGAEVTITIVELSEEQRLLL